MKKFLVFLLSLTICLTPSLTFAGAEKWEVIQNVYDKTKNTVKIEARKIAQTAANSARYKVEVPVNASTLGSSIKGMLWAGLAVGAVTSLVEGVGWIIDTGSQVIKRPKPQDNPTNIPKAFCFKDATSKYYCSSTIDRAKSNFMSQHKEFPAVFRFDKIGPETWYIVLREKETSTSGGIDVTIFYQNNPFYNPNSNVEPEYEIMSDSQLGDEVLGNGETAGDPSVIPEVYNPNNNTQAGAQTDTALDNAPPQPDTEPNGDTKPKPNVDTDGDGIPDTHDPTKPSVGEEFELPNFCSWAVTVCEWYTQYKTDSKNVETHRVKELSFWEKVQDYFNWSREPPDKDNSDNDVPVKTPEAFDNSVFSKDRFAVSRQCPIPEQHTISLSGVSVNFSFDMTPLCQVLILARPALVACSYLYAAYIVIGAARNG